MKIGRGSEPVDMTVALEERTAQLGGQVRDGDAGTVEHRQSDVYLGIQGTDGPEGARR